MTLVAAISILYMYDVVKLLPTYFHMVPTDRSICCILCALIDCPLVLSSVTHPRLWSEHAGVRRHLCSLVQGHMPITAVF